MRVVLRLALVICLLLGGRCTSPPTFHRGASYGDDEYYVDIDERAGSSDEPFEPYQLGLIITAAIIGFCIIACCISAGVAAFASCVHRCWFYYEDGEPEADSFSSYLEMYSTVFLIGLFAWFIAALYTLFLPEIIPFVWFFIPLGMVGSCVLTVYAIKDAIIICLPEDGSGFSLGGGSGATADVPMHIVHHTPTAPAAAVVPKTMDSEEKQADSEESVSPTANQMGGQYDDHYDVDVDLDNMVGIGGAHSSGAHSSTSSSSYSYSDDVGVHQV